MEACSSGFKSLMVMQIVHLKTDSSFGHLTRLAHVMQLPVVRSAGPGAGFFAVEEGWRWAAAGGLGAQLPDTLPRETWPDGSGRPVFFFLPREEKSAGNGWLIERL